MSNKSAGPVKTHEEKLIDKAKNAIEKFWPPESAKNSENAKPEKEPSEPETENPDIHPINEKPPIAGEDSKKEKGMNVKNNSAKKKKD